MSDSYNENRPYLGIVLDINGMQYFAPLEHPRPEHQKLKNNTHIIKIKNGLYGIIGLNNMIPVPSDQLIQFDINASPRRNELITQFVFCRKNERAICFRAQLVYNRRKTPNAFENKIFCNFQELELAAQRYQSLYTERPTKNDPTSASRPSMKNVLSTAKERVQRKIETPLVSHTTLTKESPKQ